MPFKNAIFKAILCLSSATTGFSLPSVSTKLPETPRLRNTDSNSYSNKRSYQTGAWGGWSLGPLSPPLPRHLEHPLLPNGKPWGDATNNSTSPQTQVTPTGVVRSYEFTIARGVISPDGIEKPVILVNGQYPGPLIEANWGDLFEVTVHNRITGPQEGTLIHWHGILQTGTPYMDGAPSMSSSPLAPGDTFAYRFIADQYGTSWWHAHYSGQYVGGIAGPMVIYGPEEEDYDVDIGPIMIQDWFHPDYFELIKQILAPSPLPYEPPSQNTAINGKMDCLLNQSAICEYNPDLAKFEFVPGKVHRLRLINSGASNPLQFSIDDHELTVIANDFVPIEPYTTDHVTLAVGQRSDILVTANGTASSYWMRVNVTCGVSIQPSARAIIYYNGTTSTANTGVTNTFVAAPNATSTASSNSTLPSLIPIDIPIPSTFGPPNANAYASQCANDDLTLTVPKHPIPVPSPDITLPITIDIVQNATQQWNWQTNGIAFRGDYNDPVLFLAHAGNTSYPASPEWNVYNLPANATSYRLVTYNRSPSPHPMHLHGHNMFVLAQGFGQWDGHTITRPSNPQRRDVALLAPGAYIVVQAEASNPGVWPYHCHIAWHLSGGLSINFIEREEEIERLEIPHGVWRMQEVWKMYSAVNVVDQIDSGFFVTGAGGGGSRTGMGVGVNESTWKLKLLQELWEMEREDEEENP